MKLRTSFFDPVVLKKDITRFSPVWGLYTVFTLLFLLLMWESEETAARFVSNAPELFLAMGMVNFLYAPLVALCLFGDLFKSRMCNALHALPLRREGWFLTHLTAGLLFCLVPNGVAALICAGLLGEYAWVAFLWLGLMLLQYLFFFGVATFGCLCAGNGVGAVAIYALINFLAVLVGWLAISFYQPLLYGIRFRFEDMANCCPIIRFCGANYLNLSYNNMKETAVFGGFFAEDWRCAAISAGVGVVLLGLSLLIYRRRSLESAGDLISFKPAAPVALTLYTLCAGTLLYFLASATGAVPKYLFLVVGLAIGFFTGKMLLERRVKVFCKKNLLIFGVAVGIFFASLGITALDPLGVTRHVPDMEQVSSVKLCASHYVYDLQQSGVHLTEDKDIEKVLSIHRDSLARRADDDQDTLPLYICYTLENGATVKRYYYVSVDSEGGQYLQNYFSSVEAVFGRKDPTQILYKLCWLECYSYDKDQPYLAVTADPDRMDISLLTDKYNKDSTFLAYTLKESADQDPVLTGLFDALIKDCQAGRMAQSWEFTKGREAVASITLEYKLGTHPSYLSITIYEDCENTVAYLNSLQGK